MQTAAAANSDWSNPGFFYQRRPMIMRVYRLYYAGTYMLEVPVHTRTNFETTRKAKSVHPSLFDVVLISATIL